VFRFRPLAGPTAASATVSARATFARRVSAGKSIGVASGSAARQRPRRRIRAAQPAVTVVPGVDIRKISIVAIVAAFVCRCSGLLMLTLARR